MWQEVFLFGLLCSLIFKTNVLDIIVVKTKFLVSGELTSLYSIGWLRVMCHIYSCWDYRPQGQLKQYYICNQTLQYFRALQVSLNLSMYCYVFRVMAIPYFSTDSALCEEGPFVKGCGKGNCHHPLKLMNKLALSLNLPRSEGWESGHQPAKVGRLSPQKKVWFNLPRSAGLWPLFQPANSGRCAQVCK